jgi:hypothetical protein
VGEAASPPNKKGKFKSNMTSYCFPGKRGGRRGGGLVMVGRGVEGGGEWQVFWR